MRAGAREGSVLETSLIGGDKTVLTEARRSLDVGVGQSGTLSPSSEAVGVTELTLSHAAGSGLFQNGTKR